MGQIQMGGRCGNTCNTYCFLQFFMAEEGGGRRGKDPRTPITLGDDGREGSFMGEALMGVSSSQDGFSTMEGDGKGPAGYLGIDILTGGHRLASPEAISTKCGIQSAK